MALSLDLTASVLVVTLAVSGLLVLLGRQQVVPFDSLLGLVAHAALAIGVIAASLVRGPQLDLMAFLFGDIFAVNSADLRWIYSAAGRRWRRSCRLAAAAVAGRSRGSGGGRGRRHRARQARVRLVLALVVAIAIKIVGALLTIAFLIMPAAAARPLAETPEQMAVYRGHLRHGCRLPRAVPFGLASIRQGGPSIVLVLAASCFDVSHHSLRRCASVRLSTAPCVDRWLPVVDRSARLEPQR